MTLFPLPPVPPRWSVWGDHASQRARAASDVHRTPLALFAALHAEFRFTLDVAALPDNALCPRYFTQDWTGERCWMNPPYSELPPWTAKAAAADALVVGLLPARTDLAWFHDDVLARGAELRFLRGRLRFGDLGSAPFPSLLAIWRPTNPEADSPRTS